MSDVDLDDRKFSDQGDLKRSLDLAGALREQFYAAEGKEREGLSRLLLSAGVQALQAIVGSDALAAAYGDDPAPSEDQRPHLERLAYRLFLVSGIFEDTNPGSLSSFEAARLEVRSILSGDHPRLFAKLPAVSPNSRRRANNYRAARHQMRAFAWQAFFEASTDMTPSTISTKVAAAFHTSSNNYKAWRDDVISELGKDHFDFEIKLASGDLRGSAMARSMDEAEARLKRDGDAYDAENRRRLSAVR